MVHPGQAGVELLAQEGLHLEAWRAVNQPRHESGKLVNLVCHRAIIAGQASAWQPHNLTTTVQVVNSVSGDGATISFRDSVIGYCVSSASFFADTGTLGGRLHCRR
jgi:hypothetical protein